MFNKLYKKLVQKWSQLSQKRRVFYTLLLSIGLSIVIVPLSVKANLGSAVASLLGHLVSAILTFLSGIISLEIGVFQMFAQFNNFLGVTAVREGWKLVRDICNMFFILILLIISFATILKIESYAYKKWLGKLVLAAILINFSKTITGFLIGFSQIIMLTFVSAFKDAVAGNLGAGLHLNEMMSASRESEKFTSGEEGDNLDNFAVLGALLLAFALLLVFVVVMLVMIVVLVGRIISLWILVILSPVAYLLQASPFGTKYAQQWWQELGKNLVAGPVLAFFLWLAFLTIQRSSGKVTADMEKGEYNESLAPQGGLETGDAPEFITGISRTSALMDYIITIGLLIAALKITQELGVVGSSFAGKMQQNLGSMGKKFVKAKLSPFGLAPWAIKSGAKAGVRKLNEGIADGKVSPYLNPAALVRGWNARRDKLHTDAKEGADAAAEDHIQKKFTGSHQGRRLAFQHSKEDEFVKAFSNKPKEIIAKEVAKLDQKKHKSSEDRARLRGLVKLAFSKGYDDDILAHEHFDKYRYNKEGELDSEIAGPKQALRAFHSMFGDDEAGLEILSGGDDMSHKTGHYNIAGLTVYDKETGELRVSDFDEEKGEFAFDRDVNQSAKEKNTGQATEMSKVSPEQLVKGHPQGNCGIRIVEDEETGESIAVGGVLTEIGMTAIDRMFDGQDVARQLRHYGARATNAHFGLHYGEEMPEFEDNKNTMVIPGGKNNANALRNLGYFSQKKDLSRFITKRMGGAEYSSDADQENRMSFKLGDKKIKYAAVKKHASECNWKGTESEIDEHWNEFYEKEGLGTQSHYSDRHSNQEDSNDDAESSNKGDQKNPIKRKSSKTKEVDNKDEIPDNNSKEESSIKGIKQNFDSIGIERTLLGIENILKNISSSLGKDITKDEAKSLKMLQSTFKDFKNGSPESVKNKDKQNDFAYIMNVHFDKLKGFMKKNAKNKERSSKNVDTDTDTDTDTDNV
jgi:hypothetical protein